MNKQNLSKANRKPKETQTEEATWISRKEAMAMLQCGKVKYHELAKYGQIKTMTFANRAFVERASVLSYIATHDLKYNMRRKEYFKKEDSDG